MTKKRGYTITELLVIMTMVAIAVALAAEFTRSLRPEFITAVSLNANGTAVQAALADGSVTAWDVATGQQAGLLPPSGLLSQVLGFSPDGSHLARVRFAIGSQMQQNLEVADLATGKVTDLGNASVFGLSNRAVAFNGDGSRVAIGDAQGQA